VLYAALQDPKVSALAGVREHADPIDWLENTLRVDQLSPEIMRVGLNGKLPEELATVVNTVAYAYFKDLVDRERDLQRGRLEALEQIGNNYTGQLNDGRRKLRERAKALGVEPVSSFERDLRFRDLLDCKRELRRVRLARVAAEARAGKNAASAGAETSVLEAQEKVLAEEEKQLLARGWTSSPELQSGRDVLDQMEGVIGRITAARLDLGVARQCQNETLRVQMVQPAFSTLPPR
jgi:hypothetical protein